MADCAAVFHWPPSEMAEMDLEDLARWRAKAIELFKAMNRGNTR